MKTTKLQFELFKNDCLAWQKKLGLTNWVIYFYHKKIEDSYANTAWHMSSAAATINLSTVWDEGRLYSEKELDRLALHEVLHVLLAQLIAEAEDRFSNQTALNIAEHNIIRTLENVLVGFPDAKI